MSAEGIALIYGGQATLEDLYELYEKFGIEFIIEGGKITQVISNKVVNGYGY